MQPPLADRELVDMFIGTLTGPFFNLLIGSSSSGFTELIITGERVESGIKSGKMPMASTLNVVKNPFTGKKETNVVYGSIIRAKNDRHHSVGAVLISNPTSTQRPQQQANQQRPYIPRRHFTKINMSLSQAL